MDKQRRIERYISKLKHIASRSIHAQKDEKAMAAIAMAATICYEYNQFLVDEDLESMIQALAERLKGQYRCALEQYRSDRRTVLFYDGFGYDIRGVASMYLNALKKNNYRIIYVTPSKSKNHQAGMMRQFNDADIVWKHVSMDKSYVRWANELLEICFKYQPKTLFFYATPWDVSGAAAFCLMAGKAERFLIDLTDHAFWLGKECMDFFCGSRDMSASNQHFKRGIPKEKMIKLGVNLIVNENAEHHVLPFDISEGRFVFSGGSLYKTLGDPDHTYYRIVDHILSHHEDMRFLYAGSGDKTQMEELLSKYPGRAFLIPEQNDFFYILQHCTLYLNTYPMFGGMMMKYAALAGKIPITLRHGSDSDGLLLRQKEAQIEYDTCEALTADVDRLLCDTAYLNAREALLAGTTISEERFVKNLRTAIENHLTDYEHTIADIDTTAFRKEFFDRFSLRREKIRNVYRLTMSLAPSMPWMYGVAAWKALMKATRRIRGEG